MAASAVARRTLAQSRLRTTSFALLFALVGYANVVGYRHSYPSVGDRLRFAKSFGSNRAVELFYGAPHDLLTVGGYAAWRVGGTLSVFAAVWGVLATVGALRGEEDAGRQELVLAGAIGRRGAYLATLGATFAGATLLGTALFLGLVAAHLPTAGSAYLALAAMAPAAVFAGVGALVSQLAATRRLALELSLAVVAIAFLLRVVADTSRTLGSLRWTTPLGWSEELRAFAGPRPAVLVLSALAALLLLAAAGLIAERRDVGDALLRGRDSAPPRLRLLSSPLAFALRSGRSSLVAWLVGIGAFALVVGILSTSFTNANLPANLRDELRKVAGASLTTPAGALGFYFLLFVLAISLFGCSQVAAVRREEADQQLETLFAEPASRSRWLGDRLFLAAAGASAAALTAGLLAWAGSASRHAGVSLLRLLEAGVNCLPTALLFLALGAFAFAFLPRAATGIAYGLVTLAFLWQLFGPLLGAPHWLLELTPFAHVGLVPAQPFRAGAAAAMLGVAALAAAASMVGFRSRDLVGA